LALLNIFDNDEFAIFPECKGILGFSISKERNMLIIAERFVLKLVNIYAIHPVVSIDEGTWYPTQVCRFLKSTHHLYSSFE
jgi:hypothetical protein